MTALRKEVLVIITFLTSFASSVIAAELPQIELPKYIISGVERATKVEGYRLPTRMQSALNLPSGMSSDRPQLSSVSIWSVQTGPVLKFSSSPGSWQVGSMGGSFRALRIHESLIHSGSGVTRSGKISYNQLPQRIETGSQLESNFRYSEVRRVSAGLVLVPQVEFNRSEFRLDSLRDSYNTKRSDFKFSLMMPALFTRAGSFSAKVLFDNWSYSGLSDLNGIVGQLDIHHQIPLWQGELASSLKYNLESVTVDDDDLQFTRSVVKYFTPSFSNVKLFGGFSAFVGKDYNGVPYKGVFPQAGITGLMPFGGTASMLYAPAPDMNSSGNILHKLPILDTLARGNIDEEINSVRLEYRRGLSGRTGLSLKGTWQEIRHASFAVLNSSGDWEYVSRRLSKSGLNLKGYFEHNPATSISVEIRYLDAITAGTGPGSEAPQYPRFAGILTGAIPVSLLNLRSSLSWADSSPLNFEGSLSSPERLIWNAFIAYKLKMGMGIEFGVENILNESYYDFPQFDKPPTTFLLSLRYGGEFSR